MAKSIKVQGMTGYGSSEKSGYRVEARSLNHRYLEVSVKLPSPLSGQEPAIREEVKKRFARGKLDIYVSTVGDERIRLRLNRNLAQEIVGTLRTLKDELSLGGDIEIRDFLPWRDLLISEEMDFDTAPLLEALKEALCEVEAMRLKEGEEASKAIIAGAVSVEGFLGDIETLAPKAAEAAKAKFAERARSFLSEEPEESRLIHEAAKAAEKVDITEEVQRIRGHIGYLRKILSEGGKIGKTLDFILQELYREANTIASKAEEQDIIRAALNMKAAIESIREQVQNIQ